jgi:asparagine synthase (glutamine-hydrolysing)
LSGNLRRKLGHTAFSRGEELESLFLDNFYCAFSKEGQAALTGRAGAVYENYLRYWHAQEGSPTIARMLYADQKTYLVELLMKQDQMSMAASIESRVPFLDHEFVAFSRRVPDRMKIRGKVQKYILKKAVEDILPPNIVYRKKMGFPTPLRQWLREPAMKGALADLTARDGFLAAYVESGEVNRLLDRHASGIEDVTDRIWRLMNLQIWGDLYFTGRQKPVIASAAVESTL